MINTNTTLEYKGTFSEENSWNGTFTHEVVLEAPEYTTKETEIYQIEARRIATYKGNVPQPVQKR